MKRIQLGCLVVVLLFTARLSAQTSAPAEMVDNPIYKSWASQKPGTKVSAKSDMGMGGMNMVVDITQTLSEVTPDKVTISVTSTLNMGGQTQTQTNKQDIAAKVPKGNEFLPQDIKGTVKETGKDSIDIAGKKYDCVIHEFSGTSEQGQVSGKLWNCPQVPGNVVKMELSITGAMAVTTKTTVVSIETK